MLWLCEENAEQRDAMTRAGMRSEHLARRSTLFPPGMSRSDALRLPLPPGHPSRCFRLSGDMLPDFWRTANGEPVVSAALREALRLPPEAAQAVPIAVDSSDPQAHAKGYVLLRVLAEAACMDRRRSVVEFRWITHPLTNELIQSTWVRRFVLDPSTVPPAALFRAAEDSDVLVATEELAARVQAGDYSGIVFADPYHLNEAGEPRSFRTAGGASAPGQEGSLGVLPARDPALRPSFHLDFDLPVLLRPIEMAVRHRLPEHYVRFLLDPPQALLGLEACELDLVTYPARVAELNRMVRADSYGFSLRGGNAWPEDWLIIGGNGCGDLHALDLGRPSPPVLLWNHETVTATVISPGLEAFAATLIEQAARSGF